MIVNYMQKEKHATKYFLIDLGNWKVDFEASIGVIFSNSRRKGEPYDEYLECYFASIS
jgi:hypothetical protein